MEEDIQDCRSCKYGWADDHWKVPTCHCPARCDEWERWEPKEEQSDLRDWQKEIMFSEGHTW